MELKIPEQNQKSYFGIFVQALNMKDRLYTLGWTDYIQINAGDVNHIDLPAQGTLLDAEQEFGSCSMMCMNASRQFS